MRSVSLKGYQPVNVTAGTSKRVKRHPQRLRSKLLLTFLPVVLMPLAIAGGISGFFTYREASHQEDVQLHERALLAAELIHSDVQGSLDLIKSVAHNPLILAAAQQGAAQAEALQLPAVPIDVAEQRFADTRLLTVNPELNQYLGEIAAIGQFAELFFTDRHGFNLAYTQMTSDFVQSDEYWWQQGQAENTWVGEPSFDDSTQTVTVDLIQAIRAPDTGAFVGVIKGGYSAANFEALVQELQNLRLTGSEQLQIVAIAPDPMVIATIAAEGTPPNSAILGGNVVLKKALELCEIAKQPNVASASPFITTSFSHGGRRYSMALIPDTDWVTITSADLADIRANANWLAGLFALGVLGLGLGATLMILRISRQLSAPLSQLSQVAQQVTQREDFSLRAPTTQSQDEVRTLAQSFNQLIEWVGDYTRKLNATQTKLEKRGQDLAQALDTAEQAQLQLVQSEKMSTLGNLVAGVAHEVNNPLGFIAGSLATLDTYSQDLLEHLRLYQAQYPNVDDTIAGHAEDIELDFVVEDLPKMVASMQAGAQRIRNISDALRTFSRADTQTQTAMDLHAGLDSALLILKHRLKANEQRPAIEIDRQYGDLPAVMCHPGQLNQVFMNLLANAIDALDETNEARSFAEIAAHPHRITLTTATVNSDVTVTIQDNGPGIPADIQAQIFDSRFTTKAVGKGTGLGLAIARQIIEEVHRGTLTCDAQLGQGTTFTITLPLQTKPVSSAAPP